MSFGKFGAIKLGATLRHAAIAAAFLLGACSDNQELPAATVADTGPEPFYTIGPGDSLTIFVWRNPDLGMSVSVRPDGRISVPLIEDLVASGKSATELSREIEEQLAQYVQDPLVTVIVTGFVGIYTDQVRIVGQATNPQAITYRANMTLLDAMISVGGLAEFAAGNRATLVRTVEGEQKQYRLRIDDLIKDGDISANANLLPGDVIIIPESIF